MNWQLNAKSCNILGLDLKLTCRACPEQYDVYDGDTQVGYLRLRHGEFRADMPDCGGETVFYSEMSSGDGEFDDDEREQFLTEAIEAIVNRLPAKK